VVSHAEVPRLSYLLSHTVQKPLTVLQPPCKPRLCQLQAMVVLEFLLHLMPLIFPHTHMWRLMNIDDLARQTTELFLHMCSSAEYWGVLPQHVAHLQ
jgi:hypothetical protein